MSETTTEQKEPGPWLTIYEASDYVRCHHSSLRKVMAKKEITGYKRFGKINFRRADLDRYMEKGRVG